MSVADRGAVGDVRTIVAKPPRTSAPLSDRIRYALAAGALAPSIHNTQPWRFRVAADLSAVHLVADRQHGLPVLDPAARQLTISCGAALMNVMVALAATGVDARSRLVPDPAHPDQLAVVEIVGEAAEGAPNRLHALASAIVIRRTVRSAFAPRALPMPVLHALLEAANAQGVEPRLVSTRGERAGVTHWTAAGQHHQEVDPDFRRELLRWTHPDDAAVHDGIVAAAFGRDSAQSRSARVPQRDFALGAPLTGPADSAEEADATLLALATEGDRPVDWLVAGLALEAVLLTAAAAGVVASYLNQAIELRVIRPRLRDELRLHGQPQLLLRLGYPADDGHPVTPRRRLEDLLVGPFGGGAPASPA